MNSVTWRGLVGMGAVLVCGPVGGSELHVQCPAGTGAVIRGDTVTCEALPTPPASAAQPRGPGSPRPMAPTPPPSQPAQTVIIQKHEIIGESAPPGVNGPMQPLELQGLHGVPEVCGLEGFEESVREDAAEGIHMALGNCLETVPVNPPLKPARWVAFKVEAVSEKVHQVSVPNELWARDLQSCLLMRSPRLPAKVRGRTFTAHFLLAAGPAEKPAGHPCMR